MEPAPPDFGIRFRRTDLLQREAPATIEHVQANQLGGVLGSSEVVIDSVQHLLAALVGLRIDNVLIRLNAPEVPIMDGSAEPFVRLIREAGPKRLNVPRKYLKILQPISLTRGDRRIAIYPSDHFKVTYSIRHEHPRIVHQARSIHVTERSFCDEIAPARTFTFAKDVELLRQLGLALGGSTENAIILGETAALEQPLRFDDEFVRHKILDAIPERDEFKLSS